MNIVDSWVSILQGIIGIKFRGNKKSMKIHCSLQTATERSPYRRALNEISFDDKSKKNFRLEWIKEK